MRRILLSEDKELVPSFFAHHKHVHDPTLFGDIVQDTIISQAKLPRCDWIKTKGLDSTRFLHGLIAEVKLDAIEDDPLGVSSEPAEMPGRLIRNIDGIRLSHGRAHRTAIILQSIMTLLCFPSNPDDRRRSCIRRWQRISPFGSQPGIECWTSGQYQPRGKKQRGSCESACEHVAPGIRLRRPTDWVAL
jgi:hypothetical protein